MKKAPNVIKRNNFDVNIWMSHFVYLVWLPGGTIQNVNEFLNRNAQNNLGLDLTEYLAICFCKNLRLQFFYYKIFNFGTCPEVILIYNLSQ